MDRGELLSKIKAATAVVDEAKNELARLTGASPPATPEEKAERRSAVRDASRLLKTSHDDLAGLEKLLSQARADVAKRKIEEAHGAIRQAEANLDRALAQMDEPTSLKEAWVTTAVEAAFADLKTARRTLEDLQTSATEDALG